MSMIWAAYACLLLAAAGSDAVRYKIPNWTSIALVVLFVLAALAGPAPLVSYWDNLLVGLIVFALGFGLFQWTGMGGGDAKLAAAIGLWCGFSGLPQWMLWLAVSMVALVVLLVLVRRLPKLAGSDSVRMLQVGAPVPLGLALAAAGLLASRAFDAALWFV